MLVSKRYGDTLVSKTIRVVAGFPTASPDTQVAMTKAKNVQVSVETVVYKRVGNTDIHADIYYRSSSASPSGKLPVATLSSPEKTFDRLKLAFYSRMASSQSVSITECGPR